MSRMQRAKGLLGEREVKAIFTAAGFPPRSLEGQGDNLVITDGYLLHVEVKRQETLTMDKWSHQAESEAPAGAFPLVVYRRSREPWRVSLLLDDLLSLIGSAQGDSEHLRPEAVPRGHSPLPLQAVGRSGEDAADEPARSDREG